MKNLLKKLGKVSLSELSDELKWIWKYIGKYKKRVALFVVIGFFSSGLALFASVLSKKLINAVTGRDSSSITLLAILYVAFGVTNIFLSAVMSRISVHSNTMVTQDIRESIYTGVLLSKWKELSAFRSGDILNRINNDVSTVSSAVLTWIPTFVTKFFQFCCAFFLILSYDKVMAVIALVGSPVTVLISSFFLGKMRENSKSVRKRTSDLVSFLGESLSETQNIKAFDLAFDFSLRFKSVQKLLTEALIAQNRFSVLSGSVISFMGLLVSYSCFGWSVYRLWSGKIDFGTMTMFLQLASTLSSAFGALVSLVPGAVSSTVAARRLMELSRLESEDTDSSVQKSFIEKNSKDGLTVELCGVSFGYDDEKEVLKNFSMTASPGEIIALRGASGAGKTTVIRLLLALAEGNGSLLLKNKSGETIEISPKTRTAFSFVPQGRSLFAGTIAENLRMTKPNATDFEIENALKTACAFDFVKEMPDGINSVVGENTAGLSEGQAQRIAIARAVLKGSPILLLDEATSALDKETEAKLVENLLSLKEKKTIIITTHRESLLSHCDRIYDVSKDKTIQKNTQKGGQ